MRHRILHTSILLVAAFSVHARAEKGAQVGYPDGYRHWTHVKSMVLLPEHALAATFGGIHHIYANDAGVKGYSEGTFKDGSVLVFDLLQYSEADGAGTEGPRKFTGVMQKDSKRFPATGGWGYEGFAGDSRTERLVTDNGVSCHACHTSQKGSGFVYSKLR